MAYIPYKIKCLVLIMALCFLAASAVYAETRQKTILVLGDSLTSGHGIPLEKAFPARLEEKLRAEGHAVKVINAGVSGDTTSGGLTRLEWTLEQQKPDYVILELGANDMLRGTDPKISRDNLQKMLEILKAKKIPVMLAGMRAAPNLGFIYQDRYQNMFSDLAEKYELLYYPFFLEDVLMDPKLMLEDGMHPNPDGVDKIVDNIFPLVEDLLEE